MSLKRPKTNRARARAAHVAFACALATAALACAPVRMSETAAGHRSRSIGSCARPRLSQDSPYRLPLAGPVDDPALLPYLADVPPALRRSLVASGLEPLLAEALRERAQSGPTPTLHLLTLRQTIGAQLGSLDSQLAALLFEVDCTGDALEDLAHVFERAEQGRELHLTIASLVTGAVSAVAASVWEIADSDSIGPPLTAAVGAGASALLGLAAFVPREREVALTHAHNLLAPIARGEDPQHLYPTFVFRLLTLPTPEQAPTPSAELLQSWHALVVGSLSEEERVRAEAILYGEGGVYSAELVSIRVAMLDQLEMRLSALHRELELLERYVTRVTAAPPPQRAP